jgi:hypothetical protein
MYYILLDSLEVVLLKGKIGDLEIRGVPECLPTALFSSHVFSFPKRFRVGEDLANPSILPNFVKYAFPPKYTSMVDSF